jgi:hypothetical protein
VCAATAQAPSGSRSCSPYFGPSLSNASSACRTLMTTPLSRILSSILMMCEAATLRTTLRLPEIALGMSVAGPNRIPRTGQRGPAGLAPVCFACLRAIN